MIRGNVRRKSRGLTRIASSERSGMKMLRGLVLIASNVGELATGPEDGDLVSRRRVATSSGLRLQGSVAAAKSRHTAWK